MTLDDIIDPQLIFCRLDAVSKKRLFEELSTRVAELDSNLDSGLVFEGLFTREKLGSTALGKGIAIPHCRLPGSGKAHGALVTLSTPIDFDAPDGAPVDLLIFLLVSGEATQEHLNMLAAISKSLADTHYCEQLRQAENADQLARLIRSAPGEN